MTSEAEEASMRSETSEGGDAWPAAKDVQPSAGGPEKRGKESWEETNEESEPPPLPFSFSDSPCSRDESAQPRPTSPSQADVSGLCRSRGSPEILESSRLVTHVDVPLRPATTQNATLTAAPTPSFHDPNGSSPRLRLGAHSIQIVNLPSPNDDSSTTTLLIRGILPMTTDLEVKLYFERYFGPVSCISIPRNTSTSMSMGYGGVTFARKKTADDALRYLSGLGYNIRRPCHPELDEHNVYMANIPDGLTEEELTNMASWFGSVVSTRILYDRNIGFVRMAEATSCVALVRSWNGKQMAESRMPLQVRLAYRGKNRTTVSSDVPGTRWVSGEDFDRRYHGPEACRLAAPLYPPSVTAEGDDANAWTSSEAPAAVHPGPVSENVHPRGNPCGGANRRATAEMHTRTLPDFLIQTYYTVESRAAPSAAASVPVGGTCRLGASLEHASERENASRLLWIPSHHGYTPFVVFQDRPPMLGVWNDETNAFDGSPYFGYVTDGATSFDASDASHHTTVAVAAE